jgi:phage baseplate assembly protein W
MSAEFLGVGWQFPVAHTGDGQVAMAAYEESIRQAIWLILGTAPGERVMRPDFGCGLHELVFAPNSGATTGQAASSVREALIRWEPRIDLQEVSVETDPSNPALLQILIAYQVRTTNNRFNLVYPFYLE